LPQPTQTTASLNELLNIPLALRPLFLNIKPIIPFWLPPSTHINMLITTVATPPHLPPCDLPTPTARLIAPLSTTNALLREKPT
jgi:hypothetical protein